MKYLGETLDIHTGGVDLMFPHHENEIAQSEAITGKSFARYWLHAEHLMVEGQKMSKSLGNFYTLRDVLAKGYAPESVRYLLASVPYRKKLNFTFDGLLAAATSIERLRNFKLRLETEKFAGGADDAMAERTPSGAGRVRGRHGRRSEHRRGAGGRVRVSARRQQRHGRGRVPRRRRRRRAGAAGTGFDSVFDVLRPTHKQGEISDAEVEAQIAERATGQEEPRFRRAPTLSARSCCEKGIVVEDTKDGVRWKRK